MWPKHVDPKHVLQLALAQFHFSDTHYNDETMNDKSSIIFSSCFNLKLFPFDIERSEHLMSF